MIHLRMEKGEPKKGGYCNQYCQLSVTFDDIVHVIDSGLIKQSYWDPHACVKFMRTQFHSKDSL